MEEELNENDLEERLYAMLHHVDETQSNLIDSHQNQFDAIQFVENGARSTLRRYWRTGLDANPYQKSNTPRDPASLAVAKPTKDSTPPTVTKSSKDPFTARTTVVPDEATPKEERSPPKPPSPVDLSIFHSPVPENVKKTIVFLDNENKPVELESSDEDEVVEVALPPKPTITIESSDEDELHIVKQNSQSKTNSKSSSGERVTRDVSASPVPSVVSSVSDEFIRSDCIALNISSRHPDKHSFDFSLHGTDLVVQTASSKKKKRKKNKEAVTSTPINITEKPAHVVDTCFATPKNKAKNKKQKSKIFTEKSVPNPDLYDSDSNHFVLDTSKNKNPYIVTEKSLPSVDVYESDSNQSEIVKETSKDQSKNKDTIEACSDSSASDKAEETTVVAEKNTLQQSETVDLTGNEHYITIDDTGICDDNIVIGNVTGFPESMDYDDEETPRRGDISKYVSSKVPSILYDNLDFDNLKGKEKICKKRRYSLTTLRAEMDKFYNESWGGEDFNHKEILKNMSRDKSLWAIDPKDRMPSLVHRKVKCNYCNRPGHRDDTCRQKPPVCHMCGNTGHYEPRCPTKICVNCGSPNFMYSTMCRNCSSWPRMKCGECGQSGHPASHCPDIWRRYHNTINEFLPMEKCTQYKKAYQLYCSGCARRGHLLHTCSITLPFSGLPVNSPYVQLYRPMFTVSFSPAKQARSKSFSEGNVQRPERNNKRLSKSPTAHETHVNKKRHMSVDDTPAPAQIRPKSPAPIQKAKEIETPKNKNKNLNKSVDSVTTSEKTPDLIPVNSANSSNHDNKGRMIQDNEVSDTSSVVTSARIYVTSDIINKLKTQEGVEWLKEVSGKLNVTVGPADVNSFLSISGKIADQELFQTKLREWVQPNTKNTSTTDVEEVEESNGYKLLPKNRNNLLRLLKKALESLKDNFGDPGRLYKNLTYTQKVHAKLKKQKVISPEVLANNRTLINKLLKSLNIILVGQAGLAGGRQHLSSLQSFQEKLMSSREKTITTNLRKEIAEHYQCIFSSNERDDYATLLSNYYGINASANKNNKEKKLSRKQRIKQRKLHKKAVSTQSIPREEREPLPPPLISKADLDSVKNARMLQDLKFFSKKIEALRNSGTYPNSKNEMQQLLRKIHPCIGMLHHNKNMNSKMTKKINKIQNEARQFLANM